MTSGIIQILIGNTNVQAAVGQSGGKYKVFPVVAPDLTHEIYVCVLKIQNDPILTKDCFSTVDTSTYHVRVWSKKGFRETETIHEVCRRALETGTPVSTSACDFSRIWIVNDYDHFDEPQSMYCHIGVYQANVKRVI